jgi:quinohemoprotein ethanol dehydrogenase
MQKVFKAALGTAAAVALLAAGYGQAAGADGALAKLLDGGSGDDWAAYGGTFGEQHFSPLTAINDGNVAKLGLAWSIDLPPGNSVAEPLEVDGVLFFTRNYSVVTAVDAKTGKELWVFDPHTPEKAGHKLGVGWGARGIAWWKGKIYVGTQDGRLIAIDAKSGKQVWSQMTVDPDDWNYITGAPRVFDGKVIIGFGGADVGPARGYVSTYDAETGKLLWRWYAVPGNPAVDKDETTQIAAKTWKGEWWKLGGGGTVWNAMTYDAETDSILLGTGNGVPWNRRARSEDFGDNLFLCSIVALDAKTGKYKWHYQVNPGESWDYNANMDIALATVTIDGKPRKVAIQAPKNGFLYVVDRETGKLINADKIAKVTWATKIDMETGRPVETPDARYPDGKTFELWPSGSGAHSWVPMAMSPKTGLVYIPVLEKAALYTEKGFDVANWQKHQPLGSGQTAAIVMFAHPKDPLADTSRLDAWNPATMKRVWSVPTVGAQAGGVVATGGNLVFQGQLDGSFNAYAADSGRKLWSFDAKAPVLGPPITYRVGTVQYVTVQTGWGTSAALVGEALQKYALDYRSQARRILTFAIGGTKALPSRPQVVVRPIDDPDYKVDAAAAQRGMIRFGGHCTQCHGVNAVSGGAAPDLRASAIPLSEEAFNAIVRDGALLPAGMPKFAILDQKTIDDIRQYIRSRAADWRDGKTAASGGH